jgi:hypothetical protein
MTTVAEGEYLGRLSQLGCVVCHLIGYGWTPPEIHHLRDSAGGGRKAPHWLGMPICPPHHRGPNGIHGDRLCLRQAGVVDEVDLLAHTIRMMNS